MRPFGLKISKHFLFASCAIVIAIAFSTNAYGNRFNTETSGSTRGFGMGNAVINTERGPYSVFYNPANLAAKNQRVTFQLVNFQVDANDNFTQAMQSGKVVNFLNLAGMYPYLKTVPNTYVSNRYSVYPNITTRFLTLGMLYEVNQGAEYRDTDQAVRVKARNRFAPVAAVSFRLLSGILRLGGSVEYLTVGNADTWVRNTNPAGLSYAAVIESGAGLRKTAGVTLTFPFRYLPSFSFVARDIGGTSYTMSPRVPFGSRPVAEATPMTFDLAAAMVIYMARRVEVKLEFNWKDYLAKIEGTLMQRAFMGAELVFFDLFHLRVGMAHGYPSAGLGIKTQHSSIEFSAYGDELDGRFRSRQDKRFVGQYTLTLGK